MKTVQYGAWKIAVDIEETQRYYAAYKKNDSQANRNFAEYCKALSAEEKQFFDAFAITPECCELEYIGASKKGDFPCGGYYAVCGEYLEYPPEELITVSELAENDFIDTRPDPRIEIGLFQFDFQCDRYEFKDIPENIPDGFICIRFWCEEMKWLLPEKPEQMMYEPPRFWEIHKIIKEKKSIKRQQTADQEEENQTFEHVFEDLNIKFYPLSRQEVSEYKKQWVEAFSPVGANIKEIKNQCLSSRKYTPFLWHMFSFEFLNCVTEENAEKLFNRQNKRSCVIISNVFDAAYRLENAESLTADVLYQFIDVTVTADDFSWTYSKTHEDMCGPYFYKK